jgi:hypothetical protein
MSHATITVDVTTVTGDTTVTPQLRAALPDAIAARWSAPHGNATVERYIATSDDGAGTVVGAAQIRRRPHTSGWVIVDLWSASEAAAASILQRIEQSAVSLGDPLIRWELREEGSTAQPQKHGYRALIEPHRSGDGTSADITGWVRETSPWLRSELRYYRQTTEFTCGGVSALLGLETTGLTLLGDDDHTNRLTELRVWRSATNVPACDPLALTATVSRLRGDGEPLTLYLDTNEPVLLEHLTTDDDIDFRRDLQELAANEVQERGDIVNPHRLAMTELATIIENGSTALLLIDLTPMIDDTTPHWVVAHAVRDGMFLIEDPWVETSIGESWVMTHELPVSAADLELMVRWGENGYRGVIVIPGARQPQPVG